MKVDTLMALEGSSRAGLTKKERLKASVEGIMKLSTIPATLQRVFEVIDDDSTSMADLVKVIEHDPPLASRIVGVANTAFYGMGRKVKNIPNAAVMLGFNMIRSLSVSVSLISGLRGDGARQMKHLWRHSFEVALASGLIAERAGLAAKEDAFLAGLINNLGRIILYQLHSDEYLKVSSGAVDALIEREEASFGAPHTTVGAWFAERYKFPRECVLSISLHHEPEKCLTEGPCSRMRLIPVVYLAGYAVSIGKTGFEFDLLPSPLHPDIMKSIYMDDDGIDDVRETVEGMDGALKEFYSY